MNRIKTVNLTAIYSVETRKVSLIVALITVIIWGVDKLHPIFISELSDILLWILVVALFVANFSNTRGDPYQNLLRRYLSYKSVLCALIGFLMSISFVEIFYGFRFESSTLIFALVINLGLLLIELGLRIFGGYIELSNEGIMHILNDNRILWIWGIASLFSLVGIILIC